MQHSLNNGFTHSLYLSLACSSEYSRKWYNFMKPRITNSSFWGSLFFNVSWDLSPLQTSSGRHMNNLLLKMLEKWPCTDPKTTWLLFLCFIFTRAGLYQNSLLPSALTEFRVYAVCGGRLIFNSGTYRRNIANPSLYY